MTKSSQIRGRGFIRIMVLLMLLALLCFSVGCSVQAAGNYEVKAKELDDVMNDYYSSDKNMPSTSILIVDNGEIVYKKCYGYANVETLEKATPESTYRLASVSKMFTSMGIIVLKDRGLLDFDTRVGDIFDDFPEYGKDITIKQLLEHTSGLKDFYELTGLLDEEFDVDNQLLDSDVYEIIKRADSTYFEPGKVHKYTDTGYVLLGLIVEKVSGTNYTEFMKANVFDPLGMEDTVVFDSQLDMTVNNRAYGTDSVVDGYITKDQSYSSATRGDGSVYSSLEDMYKWDQALYDLKIVKPDILEEAYKPPKPVNGGWSNYTCGWYMRNNVKGEFEMVHAGGTQGFSHVYYRIPEKKRAIIILSNRNESDIVYQDLVIKIRDIYDFPKVQNWFQ